MYIPYVILDEWTSPDETLHKHFLRCCVYMAYTNIFIQIPQLYIFVHLTAQLSTKWPPYNCVVHV